jgi:transposase
MEGHLLMSAKERLRKSVFDEVLCGRLPLRLAASRLNLSYRHCRRSFKRFREEGDAGLVHRSRDKPSNRGYPPSFKTKVLARYEQRYKPVKMGPTLAAEKLAKDGYEVNSETLRRWLLAAGLWRKRRKRAQHRTRRERRAHFGELVQMDGSPHRWFGEAHDTACLMNMVDDATGTTLSLMDTEETTEVSMRLLWAWVERYGTPKRSIRTRKAYSLRPANRRLKNNWRVKSPKPLLVRPARSWASRLFWPIRLRPRGGLNATTGYTRTVSSKSCSYVASRV